MIDNLLGQGLGWLGYLERPAVLLQLLGPACSIALLGAIESLLSAVVADSMAGMEHDSNQELIGQGIANTPVNGFAGCCAAIAEVDYLDRLKEIKAPALVIVGDQDHGTPPEMAQLIHENLPGSELLVIKDAAHIANIEQEAVFNQALLGFLQRH